MLVFSLVIVLLGGSIESNDLISEKWEYKKFSIRTTSWKYFLCDLGLRWVDFFAWIADDMKKISTK